MPSTPFLPVLLTSTVLHNKKMNLGFEQLINSSKNSLTCCIKGKILTIFHLSQHNTGQEICFVLFFHSSGRAPYSSIRKRGKMLINLCSKPMAFFFIRGGGKMFELNHLFVTYLFLINGTDLI